MGLSTTSIAQVENRYFDIVHNDKVIGSLQATKTIGKGRTVYQSNTSITATIIWETQIDYNYEVLFENEVLQTADVAIFVNNKPRAQTYTIQQGDAYHITKNKRKEYHLNESLPYTTIQLYFEEPLDIDTCYSEQDGSINKLQPLGNHAYRKVNAKGKENTYYYKEGKLVKASIDGGIIQFELIVTSQI